MSQSLVPAAPAGLARDPFSHPHYVIKRPFFSFLGRKFHVYAPDGSLAMFVKHPLLRMRQEFTIYSDESERVPLLTIKSRALIALNMPHDVFDARSGEKTGSIRSRGLKSILRDTWDILDANDQPIGLMQEDGAALLRRFFPIMTSKHHIELSGIVVARIRQIFRFFVKEFAVDLSMGQAQGQGQGQGQGKIDPRFAIGCALLALMAETAREQRG